MYKYLSLLLILPTISSAQQGKTFSIIGYSTYYNNQPLAIQGGMLSPSYNGFEFVKSTIDTSDNPYRIIQVQNNLFSLSGKLNYPHPFTVSYYNVEANQGYGSYIFFVDGGTVYIKVNDLSTNKNLGDLLHSKSNMEYQYLKKLYSNSVDTLTGEIRNFTAKQKTIQKYIIQHPNSYVALWDMVIDYAFGKRNKTEDDIKSILKNARLLSPTIKKTITYQTLVKSISEDLELTGGKIFPNISLDSIEATETKIFPNIRLNSNDSLLPIIKKNKFTLLDFWFSGCKPCIAQFPSYKKTYDLNKNKGFEIIGISVDRKADEDTWQKVITKFRLNWPQYLDRSKAITLNISAFPTNYLLDNNGKIIKKDISPEDLDSFLQKNLNF